MALHRTNTIRRDQDPYAATDIADIVRVKATRLGALYTMDIEWSQHLTYARIPARRPDGTVHFVLHGLKETAGVRVHMPLTITNRPTLDGVLLDLSQAIQGVCDRGGEDSWALVSLLAGGVRPRA